MCYVSKFFLLSQTSFGFYLISEQMTYSSVRDRVSHSGVAQHPPLCDMTPYHRVISSLYFEGKNFPAFEVLKLSNKTASFNNIFKKLFSVLSNCFLLLNIFITTFFICRESTQEIQTNQQLLYQRFHGNSPCLVNSERPDVWTPCCLTAY
jgi:hypothetical protein